MSELDIRHDTAPAVPAPQSLPEGAGALVEWAQQADVAYQMAEKLAATSFVPSTLRGKPADIAAAILAGQELGLKPMATLKSIDVIQGTPALRAHAMRGLLQAKGHEIELVESDDQHCVMRGRRKGADGWQEVTWTLARAERLQLLGKGEWKKQPTTMLIARATGEICRLIASDALYGMPYASEELDAGNVTVTQITRAPLSVSAITAPPQPAPTAPEADTSSTGDFTEGEAIGDWQPDDEPDGQQAWPPVTQPQQ